MLGILLIISLNFKKELVFYSEIYILVQIKMIQDLILIKITKNCFSTYSSRLIFTFISKRDFCTRKELIQWTNFSSITISRYLQEFGRAGLVSFAPGIIFISDLGKIIFDKLENLFEKEIEVSVAIERENRYYFEY